MSHVHRPGRVAQQLHDLFGHRHELRRVLREHANFQRCIHRRALAQPGGDHVSIRQDLAGALPYPVHQRGQVAIPLRHHDDAPEVRRAWNLDQVVVEARAAEADEDVRVGDRGQLGDFEGERIGLQRRVFQLSAFREAQVHHQLVAVGAREEIARQIARQHGAERHQNGCERDH